VGGSGIAVHGFEFSSQNEIPPKVLKFSRIYDSTLKAFCKAELACVLEKFNTNSDISTK